MISEVSKQYQIAPQLDVATLDIRSQRQMFQVHGRGLRFQISEGVATLLDVLQAPATVDDAYDKFLLSYPSCSRATFEVLLNRLLETGIVASAAELGSNDPRHNTVPDPKRFGRGGKHGFAFRISLFDVDQLRPFTGVLAKLFDPRCTILLLVVSAVLHLTYLFSSHSGGHAAAMKLSDLNLLLLIAIVYISVFFHELGHAAACTYFGIGHGDIGVGVYLLYPVFYSDVSESWLLSRKQRLVVDAGGLYFQVLASSSLIVVWLFTHQHVLALALSSLFIGALINLNPFFRFDGYWILSDWLGHPRLSSAANDLWQKLRSREQRNEMWVRSKGQEHDLIILLYCVLNAAFIVGFGIRLVRVAVPHLILEAKLTVLQLGFGLAHDPVALFRPTLLLHAFLLVFTWLGIGRIIYSQLSSIARRIRTYAR